MDFPDQGDVHGVRDGLARGHGLGYDELSALHAKEMIDRSSTPWEPPRPQNSKTTRWIPPQQQNDPPKARPSASNSSHAS